jgi:hypothetical protein
VTGGKPRQAERPSLHEYHLFDEHQHESFHVTEIGVPLRLEDERPPLALRLRQYACVETLKLRGEAPTGRLCVVSPK